MKPRDYYSKKSRLLVKKAREGRELKYGELNKLLREHGVALETKVLINKINRGNFSFAFALQVFAALGVKTLELPNFLTDSKNAAIDAVETQEMNSSDFDFPEISE